ncbi:helix-turn-helix protein [Paenibacillus cellulosilyticus]|uniref:Helix-turn-helix protein n=1 Tax=Paenibacillus cellulosilyticus TaxID=375489 RepID=A0A2V2YS66_9BACL|nr:helix-turn-helix transcriptional regulator [Paenibacillus cellulosilyticus]PWV97422.1 helix-turn-helix protein [Paenibacillus cellulosilyticus]QKS48537.1 helix-turn-helix transcriptional regulator [Paenibacillus cellulosilyticus]
MKNELARKTYITLRVARVLSGYTITEASNRTGIKQTRIRRYEKQPNKTLVSEAIKLATLYNCSINEIDFTLPTCSPMK